MSQLERGSRGAIVAAVLITVALHCDVAEARGNNYVMGEEKNNYWSIILPPYHYPPNGSTLKTGDTLQFIYNNAVHNVVKVDDKGYKNCTGGNNRKYTSGNDKIELVKGWNYFICTHATAHCKNFKMKIAVKAS